MHRLSEKFKPHYQLYYISRALNNKNKHIYNIILYTKMHRLSEKYKPHYQLYCISRALNDKNYVI